MTRTSTAGASTAIPAPGVRSTHRGTALLATKLAPPEPAHATVIRPRLLEQVSRHVQRFPLTLLSGPAGSGKTVLASSWRQRQAGGAPIGWLTLDAYDDDPATFWCYVLEALGRLGVAETEKVRLVAGEPPPGWLIPRLAANLAASPRPVVLVVDNADHLTDRSVVDGLDLLINNAGGRLRLVLCARADPLLPLHRYRLAGTLGEVRGDQLNFTPDETRQLLAEMGVPVTPEVAADLCAETQGWAVGLRLAAAPLTLGVPPERLVTSLAKDDGSVAQYLFAEVLEGQPAGVRRVLLRTSVTPELWPDLVDRLCGRRNVRRVLAGLAHANAFVEESPGAPGGFRIHPLFREMLQGQLAYENPAELAGLYRICAAWYAESGHVPEAIGYAVAADDWGFVTRLLVDDLLVARLLAHGSDPAARGLTALPTGLRGAEAAVLRTVVAVVAGRAPAAADLAACRRAQDDGAGRLPLRVSAALAALAASATTDDPPGPFLARVDAAAALIADLPDGEATAQHECAAALSDLRAFAALRTDAPIAQLSSSLRAAASAAQFAGAGRLRARAVGHLALLEALEGHLSRAVQLAEEAEAFAAEEGTDDAARDPAAAAALAWVHLRRYALVEAREWLGRARARERAAGPGPVLVGPLLGVLQAQQFRLRHEYDQAELVLRSHLGDRRLPRWVSEQVITELVRLAVARGHVEDGLAILRDRGSDEPWSRRLRATVDLLAGESPAEVSAAVEPSGAPAAAVEAAVIRACQLLEAGRVPAAVDELAAALELARPELMRWPFVDTPPQARRLLRTHQRLQTPSAWLNPSSGAQPRAAGVRATAAAEGPEVVQDLSERETEVLRHLADMLSTAEIAATMYISVNTVRTHIRSILRKLAVSRRNQAVRKARERGLL
jgi:LuxR family maltose regulon positive regulatory protein